MRGLLSRLIDYLSFSLNQLDDFFNLQVCPSSTPALRISKRHSYFWMVKRLGFRFFFCPVGKPTSLLSPRYVTNKTQVVPLLKPHYGKGDSLLSRCSYIWEKKHDTSVEASLQDYLKPLGFLPDTIRCFWRVSMLKPQDFLEILLGFETKCEKRGVEAAEVESLWKLFNWAAAQSGCFVHLPQSYQIMVSLLLQAGCIKEAESLLPIMEVHCPSFCGSELYCETLKMCVDAGDLESSIAVYNRVRDGGLTLSKLCYRALLNLLIRREKTELAWTVYIDMLDRRCGSSEENSYLEFIIGNLCRDGKIQEARNLLKKVSDLGIEPSDVILDKIADGYCDKKDYEDLLHFISEHKYVPTSYVCNKMISSRSKIFGSEDALLLLQKLESMGFMPDEITFGILICLSCQEGKLKNAFIYLSDLFSRNIKPSVHIYNSLVSAMFKKGMGLHVKDVFDDMIERGINPNASTFRVMLAGYCKERAFDKVRLTIGEMVKYGEVSLSPSEDALSKAFIFLGLHHLDVKVKRDTGAGTARAEFFDTLGNGLYLDTDLDDYEKTITGILDDSMTPNFSLAIKKYCGVGDIEAALMAKCEMVQWGQKLSFSLYSELLKRLCSLSQSCVPESIDLFEEMVKYSNDLDGAGLNLLIRAVSKKRMPNKARMILDKMLERELLIENKTYTAIILSFCKERDRTGLQECWEVAQKNKWIPEPQDCKPLLTCLCRVEMLKKALELFERMMDNYPHMISDICKTFIKELCLKGFTDVGCLLVEEILGRGLVPDHVTYSHLITGFFEESKFHEAFQILDIMLEKNLTPHVNTCKLLIPQSSQSNLIEKAMVLKQILLRKQSSVHNKLIDGLYRVGKVYEAVFELQQMLLKGINIFDDTFNSMLREYCRGSNFSLSRELLCIMIRRNVSLSISAYRSLVRMMCVQGHIHNVLRLKDVMLREGKHEHLVLYNILIFYLFQVGSDVTVEQVLDEMREKNLKFDEITYNFLISGYYDCRSANKSVHVLNSMIDKNLRPSNRSFRMVIDHLCGDGRLEKALKLSRLMESRGWMHGSVVQSLLVVGLLSSGRIRQAEHFLSRMEEKGLCPNDINYDVLIMQFCHYGRLKMAVKLLNVMLKKGNLPSDISYNAVIGRCCIHKEFEQALDFHAEMLHKKLVPSIESCNALVCGLCKEGKAHEAERVLGIMLQLGQTPTHEMYQSLVDRYHLDNNLPKASKFLHQMQCNGYVPDFETHWSLIANLSSSDSKKNSNGKCFLSQLLSRSGFAVKDSKGGNPSI